MAGGVPVRRSKCQFVTRYAGMDLPVRAAADSRRIEVLPSSIMAGVYPGHYVRSSAGPLFAEILQRDLDAFVVHLLVFGLRLLAALRAAMIELDYIRDRGARRPIERFDPRCRSHIEQAIEIEVNHVVVQGPDIYSP